MKASLSTDNALERFAVQSIRGNFPALNLDESFVFFDNAAGAQVPQVVLDAVNHHLVVNNVQRGGRYSKSVAVDEVIARARESVGILLNARHPSEVAFGILFFSIAATQSVGTTSNPDPGSTTTPRSFARASARWQASNTSISPVMSR